MAASLLAESENKYGHWTVEYSSIAEREFYRNKVTKQVMWDMPDEIRFFLPAKLETRLMKVFDYGHIETFKQYYSMLDVDNSGDLSDQEIKRLLNALGVNITEAGLQQLVKTVDLNGNGTIEFDEFCWMMYEMSRTDGEGELAGLQGKIPMVARVQTADADNKTVEDSQNTDGFDVKAGGDSGASETRPSTGQARSRLAATAPPALDLEALSRNLAANLGGHMVMNVPGGMRVLVTLKTRMGTAQTHDTLNPLRTDCDIRSSPHSARSTGKSTHRSQTDATNVYVSEIGMMVPERPPTAQDPNIPGTMYAGDSNQFDSPTNIMMTGDTSEEKTVRKRTYVHRLYLQRNHAIMMMMTRQV